MRHATALWVAALAVAHAALPEGSQKLAKTEPQVISLTADMLSDNLDHWTRDYAVMFYASWCPNCKRLAPYWEAIAQTLVRPKSKDKSLVVGKFDCEASTAAEKFCERIGITHYPTVMMFGFGSFKWNLFNRKLPAVKAKTIVYKGLLIPEWILDWVSAMHGISSWQRGVQWVKALFGLAPAEDTSAAMRRLVEDNRRLRETNDYLTSIAQEVSGKQTAAGKSENIDVFAELSASDYDVTYISVIACVIDRAEQYCRDVGAAAAGLTVEAGGQAAAAVAAAAAASEPFCGRLEKCIELNLEPDECRPTKCPFRKFGCEECNMCLTDEVLGPYFDLFENELDDALAKDDAAPPAASAEAGSGGGSGGGGGIAAGDAAQAAPARESASSASAAAAEGAVKKAEAAVNAGEGAATAGAGAALWPGEAATAAHKAVPNDTAGAAAAAEEPAGFVNHDRKERRGASGIDREALARQALAG